MPPRLGINTPAQGFGIGQMTPIGFQNNFSVPSVTNPVNPLSSVSGFNTGNATGNGVFTPTGFNLNNPIDPNGFSNLSGGAGLTSTGFNNLAVNGPAPQIGAGFANPQQGINAATGLDANSVISAPGNVSDQGFNFFGQEQNGAFVPGIVPQIAGLGLGLAQTFLGFEQLGLAEDQFALQSEAFRDQQRVAAQENERLQAARASASRA